MSKQVTLTDWSVWLQGTDENGNVKKFRLEKPSFLDQHSTYVSNDGSQIHLENEEAV